MSHKDLQTPEIRESMANNFNINSIIPLGLDALAL
jgi:hypothetical protein